MSIIETFLTVIGCVMLLLFSIHKFSNQIHKIAGDRFKEIVKTLTSTPLRGTFVGTVLTAGLQSSTAMTVLIVGLANAGVLSFTNSLGLIFGANIGTTITSQLIAWKLTAIAPYIVIIGFLLTFTENRLQKWGKPLFYFGLIFFSIHLISNFITPLATNPEIISTFSRISNLSTAILAGFLLTAVIQSSSVASALVVLLVAGNLLNFEQGLGIILGANLGTTITAVLASIRMNYEAKRVAIAHVLFNLIGVVVLLPFISLFSDFVQSIGGAPAQQIANAHIIFNILSAVVFLIFLKPFALLINTIIKPAKAKPALDI